MDNRKVPQPPVKKATSDRHFGLELEYIGVPLLQSAGAIAEITGGIIHEKHSTVLKVDAPQYGEFTVELDVELAQKISERAEAHKADKAHKFSLDEMADQIIPGLLSPIAPSEIVTPPLLFKDIPVVEQIVARLREAGAQGTARSMLYAFGYHINPEALSFEATAIRDTLRAFILLYDWLMLRLDMDFTRKLTGFAGPYDDEYAALILAKDYAPDMTGLITDYMALNPSRNYALDMLPLFSWLNEDLVTARITDSLVKKRPTYHFRMPNCNIDDPQWRIGNGIDCWLMVEALAARTDVLDILSTAYGARHKELVSRTDPLWAGFVAAKLDAAEVKP